MSRVAGPTVPHWHNPRPLKVLGMGTALPGAPVPTAALLAHVEARFGVAVMRRGRTVATRLGIATRHCCRDFAVRHETPRPGHTNPELAATALHAALTDAGLGVNDLAYLIGHTTSPACLLPPNIALVADRVGFAGPYMELRQACTGFANALIIAQGLLAVPGARAVAIIGSETGSVYFDPLHAGADMSQLVNLVQMGDGAAALIVAPDDAQPGARLSHTFFGQMGLGREPGLTLASGGSNLPFVAEDTCTFTHAYAAVRTHGPALFAHGAALAQTLGLTLDAMDHIIPHQANGRMAAMLGPALGIAPQRVFVNADRLGNTGSAAIWLALAELRSRLMPGERVLVLGAEATKYMFGGCVYVHG
ncbi:MAG: 3-oxoacyl-ACP synthase [Candidatus Tectomicrobia bacterium]|uniref:3-oxoacyl-ACP synthase n=1 Tax=Tectimicrobiota bacterium TaxID=2528274 RepID=A0A938B5I9_UNCTE|nr:3-oxoacyl-ACP synthase [Candidatus Tectomicrobia bacterium]